MTSLFTKYEQQRMALARQARRIADLEGECDALRAALMTPYALDAAHYQARCEVLVEENRVLRQANEAWARRADLALVLNEADDA